MSALSALDVTRSTFRAACVALALAQGCAVREAKAPDQRSLEQAEADLSEASAELTQALGGPGVYRQQPPAEAAGEADVGSVTEPPAPPPQAEPEAATSSEGQERRAQGPCDLACRALSSMRRSADRICSIAGADSSRCQRAREKVGEATKRVEAAGCGCEDRD